MTKYSKALLIAGLCAIFAIGTSVVVFAADYADRGTNNIFTGVVNWFKKGIKIGEQGVGGVTFFNGTIVNNTTTAGVDNPVTIGDKLRVDDVFYRIEVGGSNPLKFADTLVPFKTNSYSLGNSSYRWKDLYMSGTVNTEGNISQRLGDHGVAKLGAVIEQGGTVYSRFANLSNSTPTITSNHVATGIYTVDFGTNIESANAILISPRGTSTAPTAASGNVAGSVVTVYVADVINNVLIDQAFNIVIF
jgi:hypothetical protein